MLSFLWDFPSFLLHCGRWLIMYIVHKVSGTICLNLQRQMCYYIKLGDFFACMSNLYIIYLYVIFQLMLFIFVRIFHGQNVSKRFGGLGVSKISSTFINNNESLRENQYRIFVPSFCSCLCRLLKTTEFNQKYLLHGYESPKEIFLNKNLPMRLRFFIYLCRKNIKIFSH